MVQGTYRPGSAYPVEERCWENQPLPEESGPEPTNPPEKRGDCAPHFLAFFLPPAKLGKER